jgi:hypothetical protein
MKTCLPLSLFLLLAAAGCGKQTFAEVEPAPFEGTTYADPEAGFSLKVPFDWESHQPDRGPAIVLQSPPEGPTDVYQESVNIVVNELPRLVTSEECFTANMDFMERVLRGFTLESSGPATLGSFPAMAGIYRLRGGPVAIRILCYVMVDGKKYYVLTCSATESSFDAYRGIFAGIAQSFRPD